MFQLKHRELRQKHTIWRDEHTLIFFKHHRKQARTHVGRKAINYAKAELAWTRKELLETKHVLHPKVVHHTLEQARRLADPCLSQLISRESGWDPGKWNYGGSGAFGIPQALPYSKMPKAAWPRSAGGQEDPVVQVLWMKSYVQRYGGSCAALAYQIAHNSY